MISFHTAQFSFAHLLTKKIYCRAKKPLHVVKWYSMFHICMEEGLPQSLQG